MNDSLINKIETEIVKNSMWGCFVIPAIVATCAITVLFLTTMCCFRKQLFNWIQDMRNKYDRTPWPQEKGTWWQGLNDKLKLEEKTIKHIPADGHCLFRCFADHENIEQTTEELRQITAEEIEKNITKYEKDIESKIVTYFYEPHIQDVPVAFRHKVREIKGSGANLNGKAIEKFINEKENDSEISDVVQKYINMIRGNCFGDDIMIIALSNALKIPTVVRNTHLTQHIAQKPIIEHYLTEGEGEIKDLSSSIVEILSYDQVGKRHYDRIVKITNVLNRPPTFRGKVAQFCTKLILNVT